MKNMKRIASLVLALVMVFSLAISASAATITPDDIDGPASITLTMPATPEGYTTSNTYKIYKVFDATLAANGTYVYTAVDGKTTLPEGFVADDLGYIYHGTKDATTGAITPSTATTLTAAEIESIKSYVNDNDVVATVVTADNETSVKVEGLPYGYYYIDTTTGSVVMVNSAAPNATVGDKNKIPEVDKKITGATGYVDDAGKNAIAQVGTNVTYTGTITTATSVENYIYHDTMDDGLSFNNDVTVTHDNGTAATDDDVTMTLTTDYTVHVPGDGQETFKVEFKNDSTKNLPDSTKISIVYTAKVTNAALTVDEENNTAYLSYGRTPGENKTPTVTTKVYSAKFTVTKKDGAGKALAGAGFVLMNSEGAYYKHTPATADAPAATTWYTLGAEETLADAIEAGKVTEYISDSNGAVESFKGLPTGAYTLVESTVPEGYNKAKDSTFTVKNADYTADNLEQKTDVINNKGAELPSTGGMGTTLFYVFGSVMVLAAAVLLITKKRMGEAQ